MMKMCHPQAIQDADEFASSREQTLRNLALHHLHLQQFKGVVDQLISKA